MINRNFTEINWIFFICLHSSPLKLHTLSITHGEIPPKKKSRFE